MFLLGLIDSFWVPSTVMYRSSLCDLRCILSWVSSERRPIRVLELSGEADFGFVHQILSFERIHDEADTAVRRMDSYLLDRISILNELSARNTTANEYTERLNVSADGVLRNCSGTGIFNCERARILALA